MQIQDIIPPPKEYLVPIEIHHQNRQRLLHALQSELKENVVNSLLILPGATTQPLFDQDQELVIYQESNFWYLFGVEECDCYAVLEIDTGKPILFVPFVPEDSKMWMKVKTLDEMKQQYQIPEVYLTDEIEKYFANKKPSTVFFYNGVDSDSGRKPALPEFEFLEQFNVDNDTLYPILNECRVIKSPEEIKVLRHVCKTSSEGHERILRSIRPGNKEYQMEALFKFHTQAQGGCRYQAYDCICAEGKNSATLHYIVNDQYIKADSLVLNDMGAKYYGYCADITVTFPASGTFNKKQKLIYNAVLDAQTSVKKSLKPGVNYGDMHLLAERIMVKHLWDGHLLSGDIDEINQHRIGSLFFPHGLGHLLGLRVHDVGGYNKGCPERSNQPGLKKLRFRRDLLEGMCLTVEPGCYFIEFMLQRAFEDPIQSKYLNKDLILEYIDVGGVRLEDDVIITKDGYELLNDVPRSIEQVEACMRGEDWRKIR